MQLIGFCEIEKSTRKGKLIIGIPLFPKNEFFIVENNKKEKENSPDFLIFLSKIKVGAVWKNSFEKDGERKNYFSGSIFTLALPEKSLKIVIFEEKNQKEKNWSGSVFWSQDKKDVEEGSDIEENIVHDPDIF